MFKNFFLLVLTIMSLTQNTWADTLLDRINQHGTITVGTEGTFAPFTYHDRHGKLTGYDVEVTRAVAKKLGVTVDFKETPWDSMLAGLKSGRFDMVANQVALTTKKRQATFDKSESYNWSGAILLARQDENEINSVKDVKNKKAAQTLSSNYGELALKYQAKIVPVDGLAQSLLLIKQHRADVTFNDSLALLDFLKKYPDSEFKIVWESPNKKGSGFILNKDHQAALAKINAAILALKQDGTLKKIGEQFFGRDISVK